MVLRLQSKTDPSLTMVKTSTSLVTSGPTTTTNSGQGVVVHPSGDRFYCAHGDGRIREYSCDDGPWDVTNISLINTADISGTTGVSNQLRDVTSENGIDWYVIDTNSIGIIYLFRCSTPWDISTFNTTPVSSFNTGETGLNLGLYVTGKYLYLSSENGQTVILYNIINGLSNAYQVYFETGMTDRATTAVNATSDGKHVFCTDINAADNIYIYETIFPKGFLSNVGSQTKVYTLNTTQVPEPPQGICFDRKTFTKFMMIENSDHVSVINLLV